MAFKYFSLAAGVALLLASCSNLQDGAGTQSSGASGGQAGAGGSGGTQAGAWAVQTVGGTIGASGIFPEGFFGESDGGESNAGDTAEGLTPCYTVSGVSDWGTLAYDSIPTSSDSAWDTASYAPDADGYRLPTEAEWEYAALGDYKDDPNWNGYGNSSNSSTVVFAGYNGSNSIDAYAWHDGNASNKTHVVKDKDPNSYSLYDMSGNVHEWCWDWQGSYDSANVTNPTGAPTGTYRVTRGGCWNEDAGYCSVASRRRNSPDYRDVSIGFRVVRNAP